MSGETPSRTAGLALALATGLGVLADRLLSAGPRGPGFALWILLLGAAALVVVRRRQTDGFGAIAGWSGLAFAAAVAATLRDAAVATLAMWLVVLTAAAMSLLRAGGVGLGAATPIHPFLGFALVVGRAASGPVPLLRDVSPPPLSSRRRLFALARGGFLVVPLLLFFGALFASADAGFDRYASAAVGFVSEEVIAHAALAAAFAWISAGLLSGLRARRLPGPFAAVPGPRLGVEETAVVLGLLALLFLAFVGLQLGYLFGGPAVIESTSGLTVAEYARRGFFELLVVGLATLGVLLVGDGLSTARRVFRTLAGVLVACVLVVLASAAQRLALYTASFGLTVDRITAAAVMAWIAVVFLLFAATVLRERPAWFPSGAVLTGIAAAFALVAVDPGGWAARSVLDRAVLDGEADVDYLLRLGADAVPDVVSRFELLPADARCPVAADLLRRWPGPGAGGDAGDWRAWNAARSAAKRAVRSNVRRLEEAVTECEGMR